MAGALNPEAVSSDDALAPNDGPAVWAERLRAEDRDLMLVGHLPHLCRLAALLLCGNADEVVVSFRNAGIVCLGRDENGGWSLDWALPPQMMG